MQVPNYRNITSIIVTCAIEDENVMPIVLKDFLKRQHMRRPTIGFRRIQSRAAGWGAAVIFVSHQMPQAVGARVAAHLRDCIALDLFKFSLPEDIVIVFQGDVLRPTDVTDRIQGDDDMPLAY